MRNNQRPGNPPLLMKHLGHHDAAAASQVLEWRGWHGKRSEVKGWICQLVEFSNRVTSAAAT
jgi:hypothetical protein